MKMVVVEVLWNISEDLVLFIVFLKIDMEKKENLFEI